MDSIGFNGSVWLLLRSLHSFEKSRHLLQSYFRAGSADWIGPTERDCGATKIRIQFRHAYLGFRYKSPLTGY